MAGSLHSQWSVVRLAREASNHRSVSKNEVYPPLVSNLHGNQ